MHVCCLLDLHKYMQNNCCLERELTPTKVLKMIRQQKGLTGSWGAEFLEVELGH